MMDTTMAIIFNLYLFYITRTLGQGLNSGPSDGCGTFHSCEPGDELQTQKAVKGCYCDEQCSLYGDCCSNALDDGDQWATSRNIPAATSCRRISSLEILYDFFMVYQCPDGYSDETIRYQCQDFPFNTQDMLLKVPVSDRQNGFAFQNIFCAMCHGYTEEDVYFWTVNVTCEFPQEGITVNSSILTLEEVQQRPYGEVLGLMSVCRKLYSVPAGFRQPRGCLRGLRDTCARDWRDEAVEERCLNAGTRLVSLDDTAYKNKFCARCNHLTQFDCEHAQTLQSVPDPLPGTPGTVPLSILLDFSTGLIHALGAGCVKGEIYDSLHGRCRALSCEPGFHLQNHQCISISDHPSDNATVICPRIQLDQGEYYLLENGSLFLNDSLKVLDPESFDMESGHVFVCADESSTGDRRHKIDRAQGIISFCGQIISIISLLILLLVYGCFKELRNIPGKCVMCLSASLAGAQILFVVGMYSNSLQVFCQVIAILMHFCFLVAFCWMNVMAFDVWRTFHQQFRLSPRSRKTSNFIFYSIYTTVVPIILVICGIVFDQLDKPYLPTPGYGHRFCWISDKKALLFLFVLPVFILIFSNCVLFVITVYHMYKASSGISALKQANKGAKRKRVVLYAKLSTIMGLTWVFGFAASLTDNKILWYLFIIFNSLQGLSICLAFLCNRKVYRLILTGALRYSITKSFSNVNKPDSSPFNSGPHRQKEQGIEEEMEQLQQKAMSLV